MNDITITLLTCVISALISYLVAKDTTEKVMKQNQMHEYLADLDSFTEYAQINFDMLVDIYSLIKQVPTTEYVPTESSIENIKKCSKLFNATHSHITKHKRYLPNELFERWVCLFNKSAKTLDKSFMENNYFIPSNDKEYFITELKSIATIFGESLHNASNIALNKSYIKIDEIYPKGKKFDVLIFEKSKPGTQIAP